MVKLKQEKEAKRSIRSEYTASGGREMEKKDGSCYADRHPIAGFLATKNCFGWPKAFNWLFSWIEDRLKEGKGK